MGYIRDKERRTKYKPRETRKEMPKMRPKEWLRSLKKVGVIGEEV